MVRNLQEFQDDDGNPAQICFGPRILLVNEYRQLRVRAVQDCRPQYLKSKYKYPLKNPKNFNFGAMVLRPKPPTGFLAQPNPNMPSNPSAQPNPNMPSNPSAQPNPYMSSNPPAKPNPYIPSNPSAQPNPYMSSNPPAKPAPPPAKEAEKTASNDRPPFVLADNLKLGDDASQKPKIFDLPKANPPTMTQAFSLTPGLNKPQLNLFGSQALKQAATENLFLSAADPKEASFAFPKHLTVESELLGAQPIKTEDRGQPKISQVNSLLAALQQEPKAQELLKQHNFKTFLDCIKGIEVSVKKRLDVDLGEYTRTHTDRIRSAVSNLSKSSKTAEVEKKGKEVASEIRQKFKSEADRLELSRSLLEIFQNANCNARTKNMRSIRVIQTLDNQAKSYNESIRIVQRGLVSYRHKLRAFRDLMKSYRAEGRLDSSLSFCATGQNNRLIKIDASIFGPAPAPSGVSGAKAATSNRTGEKHRGGEPLANQKLSRPRPVFAQPGAEHYEESAFVQSLKQQQKSRLFPGYITPQNPRLRTAIRELLEEWSKECRRTTEAISEHIKHHKTSHYASFDLNSLDSDEEPFQQTPSTAKLAQFPKVNFSRQYMLQSKLKSANLFFEHCTDYYQYKEIQERSAKTLEEKSLPQPVAPKPQASLAPKPANAAPPATGSAVLSGIFSAKKEEDPPELIELTQTISRIDLPTQPADTGDKQTTSMFGSKKDDKQADKQKDSTQPSLFSGPTKPTSQPTAAGGATTGLGLLPQQEPKSLFPSKPASQDKPAEKTTDSGMFSKQPAPLIPAATQPARANSSKAGPQNPEEKPEKILNSNPLVSSSLFDSMRPALDNPKKQEPSSGPLFGDSKKQESIFSVQPGDQPQKNLFGKESSTPLQISPNIFGETPKDGQQKGRKVSIKEMFDESDKAAPAKPASFDTFGGKQSTNFLGQVPQAVPANPAMQAGAGPQKQPQTSSIFGDAPTPSIFAHKPANPSQSLSINQANIGGLFSTQSKQSSGFGQQSSFSAINTAPKATMGTTGFGSASGFGNVAASPAGSNPTNLFIAAPTQTSNSGGWLTGLQTSQQQAAPPISSGNMFKPRAPTSD